MKNSTLINGVIDSLIDMIKYENYRHAFAASNALLRMGVIFEDKKSVYIGEILETIFNEWRNNMESIIPKQYETEMNEELISHMTKIKQSITNDNSLELHESLMDIRFFTTSFQILLATKYKSGD